MGIVKLAARVADVSQTPIVLDWLRLAREVQLSDEGTYSSAYASIRNHFRQFRNGISRDEAIVALHIVYAWMPQILRLAKWRQYNFGQVQEQAVLVLLNDVLRVRTPKRLTAMDMSLLFRFCCNSVPAASKLLHFLNPHVFPIWDSNVAAVFPLQSVGSDGCKYIGYCCEIDRWSRDTRVRKRCESLRRRHAFLTAASDIRIIELVLFASARPRDEE